MGETRMSVRHPERLAQVHPDLVRLVDDVGSTQDIIVMQGARTVDEERGDIASGHSSLMDPTHSKHVIVPGVRDLADAVDLTPYPLNWMDIAGFKKLGAFVKARAAALEVPIRWGGDWLQLHDYDHYERDA